MISLPVVFVVKTGIVVVFLFIASILFLATRRLSPDSFAALFWFAIMTTVGVFFLAAILQLTTS